MARLYTFDFVERVESTRLDSFDFVEPCFSNIADDKEAVVLACTSLVFCALSVHVNKTEKKTTRCVGERLSEIRESFGCYSSLLMSDLMNHKAIWLDYRRIDIELFEELFNHA